MRRSAVLACSLAVTFSSAQYAGTVPVLPEWRDGFESITVEKGRDILGHLAGPAFRGRSPLNGDYNLAAGWLSAHLEAAGIEPAGDEGTYFHRFVVWDTTPIPAATQLRSADGSLTVPFGAGFSCSATGQMTWPVPKLAFLNMPVGGDWSKLDFGLLKDRWVFLSASAAADTALRRRLNGMDGQTRPALAVMVANGRTEGQTVEPRSARSVRDLPDPRSTPVRAFSVNAATLAKMAALCGAKKFLDAAPAAASIETSDTGFLVDVKVTSTEYPMVNVVGKVTGSDPSLRDEAIVIGAHLDHIGPSRTGTLFGADDNGSGCTANLMIAQAVRLNPVKPKRSVYFCFWSSEELGLLGSYAFVQRPTIELKNIAAYINMDMVGRNENDPRFKETAENNTKTVYPSGVAFNSPDFLKLLFDENAFVGLTLKPDVEDRIMRSDSGSFAWKEIPTVKVFTGDHEDYHKAGDTVDKVNYEKMTNIAKWLYLTTEELASGRPRPQWVPSPFKPKPWGG